MIKRYDITGMTCSACSLGIEKAVSKLDGILSCEVSLMGKSMKVEFDETVLTETAIFSTVKSLGYGIFNEGEKSAEKEKPQDRQLLIRLIISVCVLIPLLYVSMGHMIKLPLPFFLDPHMGYEQWFAFYQCILTAVVIGVNYKFFTKGVAAIFKKVPNMDTLVALGAGVSFIYSFVLTVMIFIGKANGDNALVANHMQLYYESAATILTLVTVGKWLEEKSKKRTGSEIEKLLKLAPDTVTVEINGEQRIISVKEIKKNDIVVVKQGEYIPIDGKIVEGNSFIDKCAITGESLPVEVAEGDVVTSAALVKSGLIKVRAEKIGEETTLSKIISMVREAGASKAPIQKFADKVAGVFVPLVTLIALVTFLVWLLVDGKFVAEHCITYAISVLVVSCPCALGLATPVAIMTATGKGASLGVLYKDAENLQKLCSVNAVLLDKTATITEGKPRVNYMVIFDGDRDEILKIACGIEKNSNHPLAKCVMEFAGDGVDVEDYKYEIGCGATAYYNGVKYLLGNLKLLRGLKIDGKVSQKAESLAAEGNTVIYFASQKKVLALFSISDAIKEGSIEAIELLKARNMRLAMLTGDAEKTARAVAAKIKIDDFISEVMPEDKLNAVRNVQSAGGCVAMVGDGINDSPALKQADVGIAMGSGTDVAIDSAGVVLISEDLRVLDTVFDLSRKTVGNIKENLFWAFFYNIIMIPVAAGAFSVLNFTFNPMIAALCMSLSSLFVVGNALRLLLYKNKNYIKEDNCMKKIVLIEGMCCKHCAKRVEDKLSTAKNVISVDVNLKKNNAVIRSREEVSNDEITALITDAGYKVVSIEEK